MDRGAWQAAIHRVAKSKTRLSEHAHTHSDGCEMMSRCGFDLHFSKI